MRTLIFDGAPNETLHEGDQVIASGAEFKVSDERAAELLAGAGVRVREPHAKNLSRLSRDELNELAGQAGVENPDALGSKDDVIDAIHAAENAGDQD